MTEDKKCEHVNTQDILVFDEEDPFIKIKEIYTFCLDCNERI